MRAMARPKPKKTPAKPLAEDDATAQTSCALYFCGPPQRPPDDDDATTTTPRAKAELAQVKSVVVSSADEPEADGAANWREVEEALRVLEARTSRREADAECSALAGANRYHARRARIDRCRCTRR